MNNKVFTNVLKKWNDKLFRNKYYTNKDFIKAIRKAINIIIEIENTDVNDFNKLKKIKSLLALGTNRKLGKYVASLDLPEIITCKGACNGCYAVKSIRNKPNVRQARLYRLFVIDYACNDDNFKSLLINKILIDLQVFEDKLTKKYNHHLIVRIHSAGDIYCKEYLRLLLSIINKSYEMLPFVKFYTYTKTIDSDIILAINTVYKNFNIVNSLIPCKVGGKVKKCINFGNLDYCKEVIKNAIDTCVICPYKLNDKKNCMDNCDLCLHYEHVVFIAH